MIGFANEEGTRFGATMTGSRSVAGAFDPVDLDARDAEGITMRDAMRTLEMPPDRIADAARAPTDLAAYVELHIEQGPVLEQRNLPLGVVTAISGATRLRVALAGLAGHAGTVPMGLRKDALAGAAEIVGLVERRCGNTPGLVGTVGMIEVKPGAVNVIPGHAVFTLDIRAEADAARLAAVTDIRNGIAAVAQRRGLRADITPLYEADSTRCSPKLIGLLQSATTKAGCEAILLPSGAGHDAVAMSAITEIGMLFVRCAGGISHNPAESITAEDAGLAAQALYRFILDFGSAT